MGLEDTSTLYLSWADQQTILAGYTDINGVRSTDGGQSWAFPSGITLAGNTVYSIVRQGSTFYAATSNVHDIYQSTHTTDASVDSGTGNVLYSTDNGASWHVLHAFGHPVVWVATDPNDANRLYASVVSSTAGGIYTTDNLSAGTGATWTKVTNPPRTQGHPFNIQVLNDGTVVATYSARRSGSFTDSSGVFVSTDHGQTWADRTGAGMHWWTKDITIDPTDPTQSTWYASVRFAYGTSGASDTGGLYRTTNRGLTWTRIFQSIGAESAAVSPTTGEMYVSTEENGLYYSANPRAGAPTFTQTSYPFRQPERIFFNPFNPSEVWVTSFGDGLMVGTSGSLVTGPSASSTTLTTSAPSVQSGASVTFTVAVASTTGGSIPTGSVIFTDGATTLASVVVGSDGKATFTTSMLAAGSHSISATYTGDSNYSPSASAVTLETVAGSNNGGGGTGGGGGGAVSASIVGAFGKVTLPASIVAGVKFTAKVPVVVTNNGIPLKGTCTVRLYVSQSGTLDGSQTLLGTLSRNITLASRKSSTFAFAPKVLPASLPAGTYHVLAQIIDATGAAQLITGKSLQVAAPFVHLSTLAVAAVRPATVRAGKSGSYTVTLLNTGNVASTGMATINIGISSDGTSETSSFSTLRKMMSIKPGKRIVLNLHFVVPRAVTAGTFRPYVSITEDGSTAIGAGASSFTIAA